MIRIENVSFQYEQVAILSNVDLVLRAGDRIGLVVIHGSGKSTFLKLLVAQLVPNQGRIVNSKGLSIGYFAQHQVEGLDLSKTPVQIFLQRFTEQTEQDARDFLGSFGFSHEQALSPVAQFSGGEKARLSLALIVYQKPNLIILDEPTNHLDMDSRDALDEALQTFSGALIVVSHDRYLLAGIVDQYWWVHDKKVTLFHGDLDAYLQQRLTLLKQQRKEQTTRPGDTDLPASKREQRQQSAQQRKRIQDATRTQRKKLAGLEQVMETVSASLDEVHRVLASDAIYQVENAEQLSALLSQQTQLQTKLDEAESEWLLLQEQVEQISRQLED